MAIARPIRASDIPTSIATDAELAEVRAIAESKLSAIPGTIATNTTFSGSVSLNGGTGFSAGLFGVAPIIDNYLTYGQGYTAVVASFMANSAEAPRVSVYSPDSQMSANDERGSVALYVEGSTVPAKIDIAIANYTSTTLTLTTGVDTSLLKYGMFIDTKHSPVYSGRLVAWAADGKTLTVSGWYQFGNAAAGQVPANGVGALVSPTTKAWAHNANIFLGNAGQANAACGFELGLANYKSDPGNGNSTPYVWGFDAVTLSSSAHPASKHFQSRGSVYISFESTDALEGGFVVKTSAIAQNPVYGFKSTQKSGSPFGYVYDNTDPRFLVNTGGSMELGSLFTASPTTIDLHTGFNNDYGARILAYGGSATNGSADFSITANTIALFANTAGGTTIAGGAWNQNHLVIGTLHLFQNGKQLRLCDGVPGSATAGILVSTAP
jgi:hypothetical protein